MRTPRRRACHPTTDLSAVGAWLLSVGLSQALQAAPANDAFAQAIPLTGQLLTVSGTTVGATREPGEPAHGCVPFLLECPPAGLASRDVTVTGTCPATTTSTFGKIDWDAAAILEEQINGVWVERDVRLVASQFYPKLDGLTGGGVVNFRGGGTATPSLGFLQVELEPAEELALRGGWRLLQVPDGQFYTGPEATPLLPTLLRYTLNFRPTPGFLTPADQSVTLVANQTNRVRVA